MSYSTLKSFLKKSSLEELMDELDATKKEIATCIRWETMVEKEIERRTLNGGKKDVCKNDSII